MPPYDFRGMTVGNAIEEFFVQRELEKRQAMLDERARQEEEDMRRHRAVQLKIEQDREARIAEAQRAAQSELAHQREFGRATAIAENALPDDEYDPDTAALLRRHGYGSQIKTTATPGIVAPAEFMQPNMMPGIMDVSPEAQRTVARGGSKYLAARTAAEERAALADENRKAREAEAEERRVWQATQNDLNRQNTRAIADLGAGVRRDAATAKADEKKKEAEQKLTIVRRGASETMNALEELADFNEDGTVTLKAGVEYLTGNPLTRGKQYIPGTDAANARAAMDRLQGRLVVDLLGEMKTQSRTGATGFGALSAPELRIIENAASKLKNPNISDTELAKELGRVYGYVRRIFDDPAGGSSAPERDVTTTASAYQDYLRRRRGGR